MLLDVPVSEIGWKFPWWATWSLVTVEADGMTWRFRFAQTGGRGSGAEANAIKTGRRWRAALREATHG